MTLEDYLPIEKIANGVIYTTDHRYVKILEIEPINFLLRSTREQQSIIFSFISYLKISPVKLQIKMISKKADINNQNYKIQENTVMIKVAVIGVGSISECHLDAYVKNKDAELYAICDINPETLKRQGDRYNIPEERRFLDYKELLM